LTLEKTILVIDDNTDIRENIAEILELAGYKTFTAENGKKGIEVALKENPSLIICDIMMPELDGYGVLHMLRKNEQTQQVPFIFLTAKSERSDFRKGMEMGADDFISKPFGDIELLNAVEVRLKKAQITENEYSRSLSGLSKFLNDVKNAGALKNLSEQYEIKKFGKKESLYTEGTRPRFLYYIVKGKVKIYKGHEAGKEYIIDLLSDSDFIGYSAILKDVNYEENAEVLDETEIMLIPKEEFLQILYTDMALAAKFIHIISQNVKEKEERLMDLAYSSLRKRVAQALVSIFDKFHIREQSDAIEISRESIAQYVGTATESLIRTLSDFKDEKLIEIRSGKIIIQKIDKLRNLLYCLCFVLLQL
jgi:DNA-binding response OmpR family regulator